MAKFQLNTGTYTGNDSNPRAITGVGFQPDVVIIIPENTEYIYWRTTGASGSSIPAVASAFVADKIESFDSDGFTVDVTLNTNTIVYHWIAIEEGIGVDKEFDVGTFTGDGTDDRNITGAGFQPCATFLGGDNASRCFWKTDQNAGENTMNFNALGDIALNYIQSFVSDGFQVGSNIAVNQSTVAYSYFSFKANTNIDCGIYTGDGNDDRSITGIGFQPDVVIIKSDSGQLAVMRTDTFTGDLSKDFANNAAAANQIQSFISDGFQVGTDITVNRSTPATDYRYIALKKLLVRTKTINSDAHILKTESNTITSDAHIRHVYSGTLTSDSHIKQSYSGILDSNAHILREESNSLSSDSHIKRTYSKSILSDAHIMTEISNTITSDAHIFNIKSNSLNSDSYIKQTYQNSISSDSFIRRGETEGILSDAHILNRVSSTIDSDAHLKRTVSPGEVKSSANTTVILHMNEDSWDGTAGEVLDSSGNVHNGQSHGLAEIRAGKLWNGGFFSGGSDYVSVPASASFNFGATDNFSVSFWFKSSAGVGSTQMLICKLNGSGESGFFVKLNPTNITFGIDENGTISEKSTPNAYDDANWHHVACSRSNSGQDLKIYIDGVLAAENLGVPTRNINGLNDINIGRNADDSEYFAGYIDEFTLWNNVITQETVSELYYGGLAELGLLFSDAHVVRYGREESLISDAHILRAYNKTITSDAQVKDTNLGSIVSDAHIKTSYSSAIISDSFVKGTNSGSITSDSHIKRSYLETLLSDAYVKTDYEDTGLTSDSFIKQSYTGTISSDSHIKKIQSKTIVSDATILRDSTSVTLTSDAHIKTSYSPTLVSDSIIKRTYPQTIVSDSYVKRVFQDTITSDSHILDVGFGTITSDAHILAETPEYITSLSYVKVLNNPSGPTIARTNTNTPDGQTTTDSFIGSAPVTGSVTGIDLTVRPTSISVDTIIQLKITIGGNDYYSNSINIGKSPTAFSSQSFVFGEWPRIQSGQGITVTKVITGADAEVQTASAGDDSGWNYHYQDGPIITTYSIDDIVSNAHILRTEQGTITSDAHVKEEEQSGALTSLSYVTVSGDWTDPWQLDLIVTDDKTIASDSYIKQTYSQTITSDARITSVVSQGLTSDAHIKQTYTQIILSDAIVRRSDTTQPQVCDAIYWNTPEVYSAQINV